MWVLVVIVVFLGPSLEFDKPKPSPESGTKESNVDTFCFNVMVPRYWLAMVLVYTILVRKENPSQANPPPQLRG